jgi:glutamyl-tRNA synthetase
MTVRVRFAPSPTGHVHIGNIRAAIFNWLFARHENGQFLLRVEDTDLERSTPEAIATLLDVMTWLKLDYDEDVFYQTSQSEKHLEAAELLIKSGQAYRYAKGGSGEAVLFRIPWSTTSTPGLTPVGSMELQVHPDEPVLIDQTGISYAAISKKGKPLPQAACLAGFHDLEVFDANDNCLFRINDAIGDILAGARRVSLDNAVKLRFTRWQIQYHDLVKGDLAKPLDSLKDFVIVRSDGSPVFHLANVCDDITQGITHIVRGDDHVENTYKHIFMFAALGATPPEYAHLPMIVNSQGKPYSKRDGDAFVGDFQEKGYLPESLFNYLTLLGWSPGDDREKLSREETVQLFTFDRVLSSAAQMDLRKLENLNGQYIADLPLADFTAKAREIARQFDWGQDLDETIFASVAALMQIRTKLYSQIESWSYFFLEMPAVYEQKACQKFLRKPGIAEALELLESKLGEAHWSADSIESCINATTDALEIQQGKLNQPLRIAVTGTTTGAGIFETMELIGRERVLKRLAHARTTLCPIES